MMVISATSYVSIWISFALDICLGQNVSISLPGKVGVLGEGPVKLLCSYKVTTGNITSVVWSKKKKGGKYEQLFEVSETPRKPAKYTGVEKNYLRRVFFEVTIGQFSSINFSSVKCSDEAVYQCKVNYVDKSTKQMSKEMEFKLQAKPQKPTLYASPEKSVYKQNETVTFTCTGNVGKPAGVFWWFLEYADVKYNITEEAELSPPRQSIGNDTCTFERTGKLNLRMTSETNGCKVLCRVHQPAVETNRDNELICPEEICSRSNSLKILAKQTQSKVTVSPKSAYIILILSAAGVIVIAVSLVIFFVIERRKHNKTNKEALTPYWKLDDDGRKHTFHRH